MTIVDVTPVRLLDEEEGQVLFDAEARRLLGISGEEFLRRLDCGYYRSNSDTPEVVELTMMLPFVR